ncbi:MAG: PTS sugar transporter subunit IIA [Anaerostipes sp.]|nr:PTS sugar transporter subunit IIA [Anaerostipes sp.]
MNNLQEKVIRRIVDAYDFITTDELSEMTGFSVSSIKHSLNNIREEIELNGAKLLTVPRKGLSLVATDEQRENLVIKMDEYAHKSPESFFYRRNYILDTLFYYPSNYTIQLFADELCVSRKIVQKDLDNIEEELKRFDIELIKVRNQGVQLKGEEFDLRQAIVSVENQKYWKHDYIDKLPEELDYRISKRAFTFFMNRYSEAHILLVQNSLQKAEEYLGIHFVDISFCRLTEYLLIALQRIQTKNIIKDSNGRKLDLIKPEYVEAAKIAFDNSTESASYMKYEYEFFAAKLMVAKSCERVEPFNSEQYEDIVSEYLEIVTTVIQKKQPLENQELIDKVCSFIERIVIRQELKIKEWDDLHIDVQEQLKNIYSVCMGYIFYIENYLGFVLTQDEIAWIALLINNQILDFDRKVTAVLVHATDEFSARYQEVKIEKEVCGLDIKRTIHIKDYHYEDVEEEVLISTVPLKRTCKKAIEVTKHISQNDINLISSFIDRYEKSAKLQEALRTTREAFSQTLIQTDITIQSEKEAIDYIVNLLYDAGYVEKNLSEELYRREQERPTTIGSGIAILHTYKEYVKESGVGMLRLKYPVNWNNGEKVKLLFLIAINYDSSEEILRFFQYFYEVIGDEDTVKKLLEAKNETEIYKILMTKM